MSVTISNQARLSYVYGEETASVSSNVAQTVMQGPVAVDKTSIDSTYKAGKDLTYIITITNSSAAALTNVTAVDDLGTYDVSETLTVTPLKYTGPARLHINGIFTNEITATEAADSVTFPVGTIPANSTATIIYKVSDNDKTPLQSGSEITNTVTVDGDTLTETVTDSFKITAEAIADIKIIKLMTPNPVIDGAQLTYTFTIYNFGNTDATNVVLEDTFTPQPVINSVVIGAETVAASEYDYTAGKLTLPKTGATLSVTVPAAEYDQDETTGVITVNPGITVISVSGTI